MDNWLIRLNDTGCALIWKRKFFLFLIPLPWSLHSGTSIIRTPDSHTDVLKAAIDYVTSQYENSEERIKMCIQIETKINE